MLSSAIFLAVPIFVMTGCGSSVPAGPPSRVDSLEAIQVDAFFLRFRQKVQSGLADSLPPDLTRESIRWLEDMRQAARTEPVEYLQPRPFFEILCIMALRVERRLDPSFDDRAVGLLRRVIVGNDPVRRAFLKNELAPPLVRGEEASIGLREAPQVPVFRFAKEGGRWRFHLSRSLPLILQGAESLARQRKPTRLEQAIFLIETFGGRRVLPEDLRR
jgi:hypothetical protein